MTSYYTPLQQESLLQITGPDSITFLQGQTTCDTRLLDAATALPGVYCTPQGRVVCDFLLSQAAEEHYFLRMRANVRSHAAATFGKYIIFSKAQLQQPDDWRVVACWGPAARDALNQAFGAAPTEQHGVHSGDGFVLVQIDTAGTQYECYLSDATAVAQLAGNLQLADEASWQSLQIDSGVGRIEAATIEEFIPQMLNYDLTGHISFNKGCYTGQEVVARLHYRGKPKRRMYLASLASGETPQAGTPLYSGGAGQSVGNVVNAAAGEGGTVKLLLTATEGGVEQGLHLEQVDGPLLEPGTLPYPLQTG